MTGQQRILPPRVWLAKGIIGTVCAAFGCGAVFTLYAIASALIDLWEASPDARGPMAAGGAVLLGYAIAGLLALAAGHLGSHQSRTEGQWTVDWNDGQRLEPSFKDLGDEIRMGASAADRMNAMHEAAKREFTAKHEARQSELSEHCCRQYADLSGLTPDEVERIGSCGCVQAKRERDAFKRDASLREAERDVARDRQLLAERERDELRAEVGVTRQRQAEAGELSDTAMLEVYRETDAQMVAAMQQMARERDELRADAAKKCAYTAMIEDMLESALTEVKRMRPVAEAAKALCAWDEASDPMQDEYPKLYAALEEAVSNV